MLSILIGQAGSEIFLKVMMGKGLIENILAFVAVAKTKAPSV